MVHPEICNYDTLNLIKKFTVIKILINGILIKNNVCVSRVMVPVITTTLKGSIYLVRFFSSHFGIRLLPVRQNSKH